MEKITSKVIFKLYADLTDNKNMLKFACLVKPIVREFSLNECKSNGFSSNLLSSSKIKDTFVEINEKPNHMANILIKD